MNLDIQPVSFMPVTGKFELSHLWCLVCQPARSLCGLERLHPGKSDSGFHCPTCEEMIMHPCPKCGSEAVH